MRKKNGWRKRINRKNEEKINTPTLRLRIFLGLFARQDNFGMGPLDI